MTSASIRKPAKEKETKRTGPEDMMMYVFAVDGSGQVWYILSCSSSINGEFEESGK